MANLRIADLLPPEPPARSRCRSVSDTSELCNDPIARHVEGSGGSLRAAASGINPLSAEAGIAACSRFDRSSDPRRPGSKRPGA
jgi:hypothetical protein